MYSILWLQHLVCAVWPDFSSWGLSGADSHSGTGSVSAAAPGERDTKREISFRNAIADLDGIVKNAGPEDEGSDSTGGNSHEDILPLMSRSQWPRVLRDDRGDGTNQRRLVRQRFAFMTLACSQ